MLSTNLEKNILPPQAPRRAPRAALTHGAQWRLFSTREFREALSGWQPEAQYSYFPGIARLADRASNSAEAHVHGDEGAVQDSLKRLQEIFQSFTFEHGREAKIPRANVYRPYRLTIGDTVVAIVALKASEAFNLCEVDVFLTAEAAGLVPLDTTRAALLFAFSDAVKNGGSMAVQFTRECAPKGVPVHVRQLAKHEGVELLPDHVAKGTLSPEEVRSLYLCLCGLPAETQLRVRSLSSKGLFSIERICYFAAHGMWPPHELMVLLSTCPYPELLLGQGISVQQRHLFSTAMAHGRAALLSGTLHQTLQYQPSDGKAALAVQERNMHWNIHGTVDVNALATVYEALPATVHLQGWSFDGGREITLPAHQRVLAVLRPRMRDEQRIFLLQDLEAAAQAAQAHRDARCLLVLAADSRRLPQAEIESARRFAAERRVEIIACPLTLAAMDSTLNQRLRAGRTVRP